MTGLDSRRVSWVTLGAQAMNKRTGVLSEYPSLTGFPLIPYYSCQSPLVILLITLCCPSIVRLAAAASMRAEQESQKAVLTGWPAPQRGCNHYLCFLVWISMITWAFSFRCRPLLPSLADTETRALINEHVSAPIVQTVQKHQSCWCACGALAEGCGVCRCFAPVSSANRKMRPFHIGGCSESILFSERNQLKKFCETCQSYHWTAFWLWWVLFDRHALRQRLLAVSLLASANNKDWLCEKYHCESYQSYHLIVFGWICPTELGPIKSIIRPELCPALACCSQDHSLAQSILSIVCFPRASAKSSSDKRPYV